MQYTCSKEEKEIQSQWIYNIVHTTKMAVSVLFAYISALRPDISNLISPPCCWESLFCTYSIQRDIVSVKDPLNAGTPISHSFRGICLQLKLQELAFIDSFSWKPVFEPFSDHTITVYRILHTWSTMIFTL